MADSAAAPAVTCRKFLRGSFILNLPSHHSRLEVERRAADDLEQIGGGGLLLQRFPQLVEQARVLDGDDGLLREIADQLDLFLCEGSYLLTVDGNCADRLVLLEHRHGHVAPCAAELSR